MKFIIYNLGCKVNSYESNVMTENLENAGYILTDKVEDANIAIVNTCSVTNTADSKSLKTLRQVKKNNPNIILIACGCLAQVNSKIIKEKTNADIIIGNIGKSKIVDLIKNYLRDKNSIEDIKDIMHSSFETMKLNNFDKTRAFVKIQDGCNNFCSYCIIPYARGQLRSRPKDEVLNEVSALVNNGYKEIVLTGIHTGKYGEDFPSYTFSNLLKDILDLKPTIERLRISSIEQGEINDDILQLLKDKPQIANHFHIPLQSGSDSVLKRMNRKYLTDEFYEKLCKIRKIKEDVCISTDVIVGFPGETEEEFNETYEFIKKCEFAFLHVFPFSARSGTPAAKMEHQVDPQVKKERVHKLLALSAQLQNKYQSKFIGKELDVLFEEYDEKTKTYRGHSSNYIMVHKKSDTDLTKKLIKVIYEG